MDDHAQLLRRFVDEHSDEAFTALVQQHVNLVYSSAIRRLDGDAHAAADVTQEVFTALARQARRLTAHPVLGAWLHATTRNLAVDARLAGQRRSRRHEIAMTLETAHATSAAPEWDRLMPVLDAAIDELSERDRQPVVMRFLERRRFKEIGRALAISEDAARVRTDRALEKLRAVLERRGITSTAAALGAAVSSHATVSTPAALVTTLATETLAIIGSNGGFWTAVRAVFAGKYLGTVTASVVIAFGAGSFIGARRTEVPALRSTPYARNTAALLEERQRLEADVQRLSSELDQLKADNVRLQGDRADRRPVRARRVFGTPLQRHEIQTSVLDNLRQLMAARDQYQVEHGRPPASIKDLVGPDSYIKYLNTVDGENYASLPLGPDANFLVTTVSGITIGYQGGGPPIFEEYLKIDWPPEMARFRELREKVAVSKQAAREAYRGANQGKEPPQDQSLVPYFATPQQGADFVEYLDAYKAARAKFDIFNFK